MDDPKSVQNWHLGFNLFDLTENNNISVSELGAALASMGQNPTEAELQELIAEMNVDLSRGIGFDELLVFLETKCKDISADQVLLGIFKLFDKDGTGSFGIEELKELVRINKLKLTEEDMNLMIEEVTGDINGKISLVEFQELFANIE